MEPQGAIVSRSDELRGFGEQRGCDDSAYARQGQQDRHVALLAGSLGLRFLTGLGCVEFLKQPFEVLVVLAQLSDQKLELVDEDAQERLLPLLCSYASF